MGSYQLADGGYVDIAPATSDALRWRKKDGTTGALTEGAGERWTSTMGWTGRDDGKRVSFDCAGDTIDFDGTPGQRIEFNVFETRFDVEGASLSGRLVMPKGEEPVSIAVLVHGAESSSAREAYALQRMFPSSGIGALFTTSAARELRAASTPTII